MESQFQSRDTINAKRRAWYAANREKILQQVNRRAREWRKANPELAKKRDAIDREKKWEKRRAYALLHYQRTRENRIASSKKWTSHNRERAKENFKQWYLRNRESILLKRKLRRAERLLLNGADTA